MIMEINAFIFKLSLQKAKDAATCKMCNIHLSVELLETGGNLLISC